MARRKLRLFVWDDVLEDHYSGVAFALARSAEEAKKLLIDDGVLEHLWDGVKLQGQSPLEYDGPMAGHVWGGG